MYIVDLIAIYLYTRKHQQISLVLICRVKPKRVFGVLVLNNFLKEYG